MDNFNHIFRNFEIECSDKVRHNAILDVCRKRDYAFDDYNNVITIVAYMTPQTMQSFFDEVDKREEEMKKRIDINLSEEQKIVLKKVLDMLTDTNIGLCHDYVNSGELCAFNSKDGKVYACSDGHTFFSEDDVEGELFHIPSTYNGKEIYSFFCGGFAVKRRYNS